MRRSKLPFMLRDFLPILQISISEFNAYLNIMKREAKISVPPPDPVAWIPRIASECNFSQQSQILAAKYVRVMMKSGETFGMLPHVVAAIALHRMGATIGDNKTLSSVAKAARCSATSILKGLVSESVALRELKSRKKETARAKAAPKIFTQPGMDDHNVVEQSPTGFSSLLYNQAMNGEVEV
jgi:transcription initiation factor TFIIIB Brf1 subunit/transcription initiation factor TFIIB